MLPSQFSQKCLDVLHASSVRDFSKQVVHFAQDLGFCTVAVMVITDHSPTLTEFQTVTNVPEGYRSEFDDLDASRIDPVSQHCKRSMTPIVWDRRTYRTPAQQELWDRQSQFGLKSGIAFAMHLGRGRHYMFGADWDHERCESVSGYKQTFEDLLTFATHAQAAAFDLCIPSKPDTNNSLSLARSELEALRWTMDGKTSWEVGHEMAISERHATLLLNRAMKKLGCTRKYEAVLKAIKLGLIECE